jgi:hypothetical protein
MSYAADFVFVHFESTIYNNLLFKAICKFNPFSIIDVSGIGEDIGPVRENG